MKFYIYEKIIVVLHLKNFSWCDFGVSCDGWWGTVSDLPYVKFIEEHEEKIQFYNYYGIINL